MDGVSRKALDLWADVAIFVVATALLFAGSVSATNAYSAQLERTGAAYGDVVEDVAGVPGKVLIAYFSIHTDAVTYLDGVRFSGERVVSLLSSGANYLLETAMNDGEVEYRLVLCLQ